MAALHVRSAERGTGTGLALVRAIEGEAVRLGCRAIYTAIVRRESRLLDGWEQIDDGVGTLRGPVAVFRKTLLP